MLGVAVPRSKSVGADGGVGLAVPDDDDEAVHDAAAVKQPFGKPGTAAEKLPDADGVFESDSDADAVKEPKDRQSHPSHARPRLSRVRLYTTECDVVVGYRVRVVDDVAEVVDDNEGVLRAEADAQIEERVDMLRSGDTVLLVVPDTLSVPPLLIERLALVVMDGAESDVPVAARTPVGDAAADALAPADVVPLKDTLDAVEHADGVDEALEVFDGVEA